MADVKIEDSTCIPKFPTAPGEDRVYISDHYLAVVDGATAKDGKLTTDGARSALAADRIVDAITAMSPTTTARAAIDDVTAAMADVAADGPAGPSAAVLIFSVERREIWSVGSCAVRVDDEIHHYTAAHEEAAARTRSAYLTEMLQRGASVEQLRADDPGRRLILPVLRDEYLLRNVDADGEWFFGAIDGTHVPDRHIRRFPVPPHTRSVILASDGYLMIGPTLQECEQYLADLVASDPLMISKHPQTKGMAPNAVGHDDRSLIHVRLESR